MPAATLAGSAGSPGFPASLTVIETVATLLSALAVPLLYGFLRSSESRRVALTGALMFALCGPVVRFTCHYGPEAFALSLTLAALWLFRSRLAVLS